MLTGLLHCHGTPPCSWTFSTSLFVHAATSSIRDTIHHPYISTCFCGKHFYSPYIYHHPRLCLLLPIAVVANGVQINLILFKMSDMMSRAWSRLAIDPSPASCDPPIYIVVYIDKRPQGEGLLIGGSQLAGLHRSSMDNRDIDLVVPETTGSLSDGGRLGLEAETVSDVPLLTLQYVT